MTEFVRHHTGENEAGDGLVLGQDVHTLVFADMQKDVFDCNKENGWFDSGRSVGDECALLHSEVSEALEEFREGRMETVYRYYSGTGPYYTDCDENEDRTPGKPVGFPSELADVLIRLLDTAERHGVDLVDEFRKKMKYNRTRSHRHGGKAL